MNGEAWAVTLDISKAFDRVLHADLLHKLKSHGVSGRISDLIKSFFTNRVMKFVLYRYVSRSFQIKAGGLQDSILGPTFFLIFLNDHPAVISSQLGIYADDTTIYSCLHIKFDRPDKLKLAAALEMDLFLIRIYLVHL